MNMQNGKNDDNNNKKNKTCLTRSYNFR
jgi:hypothetical protein